MKKLPALLQRPGSVIAAGIAAWPVLAYSVASAAGVDGCVRTHGVVGFMATHGSMMRHTPACPSTAVGLTHSLERAMTVALIAASVVVFVHLLVAILGTHMEEWLHRTAEAIAQLIAPALPVVRQFLHVRFTVPVSTEWGGDRRPVQVPWRRGPPVMGCAAV